jgi:hypothetical protein
VLNTSCTGALVHLHVKSLFLFLFLFLCLGEPYVPDRRLLLGREPAKHASSDERDLCDGPPNEGLQHGLQLAPPGRLDQHHGAVASPHHLDRGEGNTAASGLSRFCGFRLNCRMDHLYVRGPDTQFSSSVALHVTS